MKNKAIIFDWIGTLYERDRGPFPYTREVLTELYQDYKIGLVSKRKDPQKGFEELKELSLESYFDSVIIARRKTPIEFRKCLAELEITPANTLVVGDRTIREIRIGNQLGCTTYWINAGDHAHELPDKKTGQPNYTINSIKDLLKLLK
jgi:FMN phosphatase YigB (HAD superfamily)